MGNTPVVMTTEATDKVTVYLAAKIKPYQFTDAAFVYKNHEEEKRYN